MVTTRGQWISFPDGLCDRCAPEWEELCRQIAIQKYSLVERVENGKDKLCLEAGRKRGGKRQEQENEHVEAQLVEIGKSLTRDLEAALASHACTSAEADVQAWDPRVVDNRATTPARAL